jgi:phosphonate transport system substrate-binding protein
MTNHPQKADRFFSEKCDSSGIRFRPLMIFLMLLGYSPASLSAEFSLGIVPQFDSRKIEEAWAPIAREIELKTGHRIILRGTPTIPDFETRLYKGEFDFAYMNPYHFVQAQKSQRYTALLRDQAEPLQGIIVVRNDNPIKRLEELHGKKIAMPAPNAFGASLIPRAEFARKFKITPEISYVRSHASVYRSVIAGTVDAGGGIESILEAETPAIKNQLRILYKTVALPTHPIAAHSRVPAAISKQFQEVMLAYAETPEGRAQLSKVPIMKIGTAVTGEYKVVEKMRLDEFFVQ